MTPKDGQMPRSTMAGAKPFVVCSISTKRYAPTTNKTPVRKLSRIPPTTTTKERLSLPREHPTRQTSRPGCLPTVFPKVESHRPLPNQISMPAPNKTTKAPLRPMSSAGRSLPGKTPVPKPLGIVARLKEGKLTGGCPEPVRSTQDMNTKELPPRPSCVPRTRVYRSSVGVMATLKGNQDVKVKVSTACPHNPGIIRQKPCVRVVETSVNKPGVASDNCNRTPVRDRRLTPPKPVTYPHAVEPAIPIASSPLASPDLSSFPSQSWKIVVGVAVKQIKTPTNICDDETPFSRDDALNPGVAGMPKDSCGRSESESAFCSPALSSSSTVVETPARLADPITGLDGMVKIGTQMQEPSTGVSKTVCAATIISPSRNSTSSMAKLARAMDGSQASSPTSPSDNGNRTLMTVRRAVEIARAIFSPSRRTPQSRTETASFKAMAIEASRIRNLFIPPLDKDAKASKNPATQMEIEMLRARRQVAGGGVVDPRLNRLGSLAAMAIVTKIGASSPDTPGQC